MDMKDVAAITTAKSFNKKWWDSKRPLAIKGTGTGAELDAWEKACPQQTEKLSLKDIEAAEKAGEKLRKSLKAAQAKCGKSQQESLAGIKKMLVLLDSYETQIADRKKEVGASAGDIVAVADAICVVIGNQSTQVDKHSSELKDARNRIKELAPQIGPALTQRQKTEMLAKLGNEGAVLDTLDADMTATTNTVKTAENPHYKAIAAARTNKLARAALQTYETARSAFDKKWNGVMHEVNSAKMDLADLRSDLVGVGTADKAIESLNKQVETLEDAPGLDRYAGLMDLIKKNATEVVKGNKDPANVQPSQWDSLAQLEAEFNDEWGGITDADNILSRAMRTIKKTAEPFKGVVLVDDKVKRAETLAAKRAKERTDLLKIAPVFQKQLKDLMNQMP